MQDPAGRRGLGGEGVDAEGHGEDFTGERQGIGGDPVDEAAEGLGEGGDIEDGRNLLQAVVPHRGSAVAAVPDDSDLLAPVQGDHDDLAGLQGLALGNGVVEGAGDGSGQEDVNALPAWRLVG
jgi:hypothetical protein